MKKYILISLGILLVPFVLIAKTSQEKATLDTISQQLNVLILEAQLARESRVKSPILGGAIPNVPTFLSAATSSAIIVGPENSVQVVATSSRRSYLYLSLTGFNSILNASTTVGFGDVFCRADSDNFSAMNIGIRLSASSTPFYEFTSSKGNLYTGGVRCSSRASTTISVTEYSTP